MLMIKLCTQFSC